MKPFATNDNSTAVYFVGQRSPSKRSNPINGISRRDCLGILGGSLAGLALTSMSGLDKTRNNPPVVDTHLHCFAGADSQEFPYHPNGPYRPVSAATPEHLLSCMDGAGVSYAIVVHPEPYQDDHRYLDHCLEVGGGRLKGTCLFFADRPKSLAAMPAFLRERQGNIVASRVHAYAPDRLPPFGKPELRKWWRSVADAGIAVQLHFEPRYAPGFERYIREFADTRVIIDHLGRPFQGSPEEHARVIRWADFPNTVMKLSSIPPQERYPHQDVGPIIRQLTNAWGAERMIYGGGFNGEATPASYRRYRQDLLGYLSHLSPQEQVAILGANAAQLFGWS
ncbi:Predicted metal-dependent hydrolase, TIM-barrel fold [Cyclobacterium xiamenense]|uniref:Predicted metal-dependent hydrolase, TIM-barrel fold n=1 Tax=Cyclobacterium xiamenense TaxID=1297121 RepID=A0A1H7A4W2_9BACT|nr:amidohydrolase family protein [Cyclobacterium xiamenense]SEJ60621.1 Predicted metal-dependent hydrolase, TIM-barrel fold [Cyclobacterium xiamenense]